MKLILFDFDKTLTYFDTLMPMSFYLCKSQNRQLKYFLVLFCFILFRFSFYNELLFKQKICSILLKRRTKSEIENIIKRFYNLYANEFLNEKIVELLKKEWRDGNKSFIVSSTFNFFLEPLKEIIPIADIESTTAECIDGIYSGKINGTVCNYDEKWKRIFNIKRENVFDEVIAYGDSKGDSEMLKNSDSGFWVKLKIKDKREKIKAIFHYLTGKIYKPDCETEIITYKH